MRSVPIQTFCHHPRTVERLKHLRRCVKTATPPPLKNNYRSGEKAPKEKSLGKEGKTDKMSACALKDKGLFHLTDLRAKASIQVS